MISIFKTDLSDYSSTIFLYISAYSVIFLTMGAGKGCREGHWRRIGRSCGRGDLLIWIIVGQGPTFLLVGAGEGGFGIFLSPIGSQRPTTI